MTTRSSSPASFTFDALGVSAALTRALADQGFSTALPIQSATLPDTLAGRDVLGRGRTGSGKTLAFAIPLADRLSSRDRHRNPNRPAGLVLAPTRELATQIAAALQPLTAACGLRVVTIFGGVPQARQVRQLRAGADIVVACPGRLEDLIKQNLVALDEVRITVLDEADHMADLGFLPGVTRILAATPADGQRMLFSATLDNGVNKLVQRFLRNPLSHTVDEEHSPVPAMTHHVFEIADSAAKRDLVHTLASGTGRRILFMRTKHHARRLARQLTTAGIPAADLHGNLSQVARDRNLAAFAEGSTRVLVATDIAARGVHVDDVELVVHVDPPAEHKAYLHRSGRTARAGSTGDVVTIMLPEQRKDVTVLLRKAGLDVRPQRVTPQAEPVTYLVGTVAPLAAPQAPAAPRPQGSEGNSRRGNRRATPSNRTSGNRDRQAPGKDRSATAGQANASGGKSGRPQARTGARREPGNGASTATDTSRTRSRPASRGNAEHATRRGNAAGRTSNADSGSQGGRTSGARGAGGHVRGRDGQNPGAAHPRSRRRSGQGRAASGNRTRG